MCSLPSSDRIRLRHGPLRGVGRRRVGGAPAPRLLPDLLEQKRELRVMSLPIFFINVVFCLRLEINIPSTAHVKTVKTLFTSPLPLIIV